VSSTFTAPIGPQTRHGRQPGLAFFAAKLRDSLKKRATATKPANCRVSGQAAFESTDATSASRVGLKVERPPIDR
jgi:hypothetical protein